MKRFAAAVSVLLCLGSVATHAQSPSTYPAKPVALLVGFGAGGGTDLLARYYAKSLADKLGQPFVVENKTGAGGALAINAAVKAPADGYTLLMGTTGIAVDTALGKASYSWQRDLAPVAMLGYASNVLVVSQKSSIHSVQDLIAEAGRRHVTFGSPGITSSMHMTGELFKQMAKVRMTHVPYRAAPPAEQALLAGDVDVLFDNMAGAMAFIEAGKFRPIAVSSATRNASLPDVPTIDEAGLKGFETTGTFFLMAPAKTPPEVIARLASSVEEISREPETLAFLGRLQITALHGGSEAVSAFMEAEVAKWTKVVTAPDFESAK
ncbi:tripartite tricarboxylate transporter substrate binding protein [Achromobacter sp. SD115]|uniref:Bug family tripartite tricarboxylate transporter substrate binding protein n=1 Tax=unclassified Achromobacter TaxID=2626865 RepID=UPI001A96458B|nr:tripartite tricarboxylate transporter substrate-binding protein [Achromobacter sp. SD115]MBO1017121.1 tripartite tricarboxylate transporter substrate binding protein [Achromobacter sp. SD115]